MCHDNTTGFELQMNNSGTWRALGYGPNATIPSDKYQYAIYPSIDIPLAEIKDGQNQIQFRVAPTGWCAQSLVYGATLRVYYKKGSVDHPTGSIATSDVKIGLSADLEATAAGDISRVDFVYKGHGVNWEGEGNYTQWHYHFFKDKIQHRIGSATASPWKTTWNTEWVPTQPEGELQVCARLVGTDDMVCMTDALTLYLQRAGHSVELGEPYNVPEAWVTRKGAKSENFDIEGDPSKAKKALVCWSSWGDHCGGGNVNGTKFGCGSNVSGYNMRFHEADLAPNAVRKGQNKLTIDGGGHHGMEVNWPGPMVLVQYSVDDPTVNVVAAQRTDELRTHSGLNITQAARGLSVRANATGNHRVDILEPNGRLLDSRSGYGPARYDITLRPGVYVVQAAGTSGVQTRQFVVD